MISFQPDPDIDKLLHKHQLLSDQVTKSEIEVILLSLKHVVGKQVSGCVVEFGCYAGTTSVFVQRWLRAHASDRLLHVYDSFAGLPDKLSEDDSPAGFAFKRGELIATKQQFIQNCKKAHVPLPVIHKGWFESIHHADVPSPIALAFLDGDYFSSIRASLALIQHKMSPGGVIIIDDYLSTTLPGAKKATDQWLRQTGRDCSVREGMAIVIV